MINLTATTKPEEGLAFVVMSYREKPLANWHQRQRLTTLRWLISHSVRTTASTNRGVRLGRAGFGVDSVLP